MVTLPPMFSYMHVMTVKLMKIIRPCMCCSICISVGKMLLRA